MADPSTSLGGSGNGPTTQEATNSDLPNRFVGDFSVGGKIIIITGGGSGICLAFAKLLASASAPPRGILLADLRLTDEAETFKQETNEAAAAEKAETQVVFKKTNVAKRANLEELVTISQSVWGNVPDVWVAGAGVFEPRWSSFWEDTEEDGYATLDINLTHPMKLTRLAIKSLVSHNKPGVVVALGSTTSLTKNYSRPIYCASKHAINSFVRSMEPADQLEGVKVVCIMPGIVSTPMWLSSTSEDAVRNREQFSYTDEVAISPEEVAEAMLELVERKEYPGGTVLRVDRTGRTVIPFETRKRVGVDAEKAREITERSWGPVREMLRGQRGREGKGRG